MFYAQSTAKCPIRPVNREVSYQGETKCTVTTSTILIRCVHCSGWDKFGGEIKSNEPVRQKLGSSFLFFDCWEGGGGGGER